MANTLTNLIPDAYAALDVVSRELVGFIPSVARDAKADRVAVGQNLRVPVTPANTSAADITAAMSIPSASDQTITPVTLTINKSRYTKFSWSGTEQRAMDSGGPGYLTLQQDQIAQALRALVNEMEVDIATAVAQNGSRAYGTAGTTPFGTAADLTDLAEINKILDDNGAPMSDRHLILSTTASAKLRGKHSELFKVNEAGNDDLLRRGKLGSLMNFAIHESAQVNNQAIGTGTSYVLNGSHAVGATSVVIKTGSGTVVAGDVLTINSYKYVVATGASAAGTITIQAPGLRSAGADGDTVTINAISVRNAAIARNSTLLGTRLPDIGSDGDLASDRATITDPYSNISFELAVYPGFRMNVYFVGISWGVKVIKPEHAAILLG